jgi:hypothetical protein
MNDIILQDHAKKYKVEKDGALFFFGTGCSSSRTAIKK